MSRWVELAGKYVDLDEVRAVELIDNTGCFGAGAILTVPGGSVTIPIETPAVDPGPYPVRPDEPDEPPRPWFFSSKAKVQAWDAWRDECRRLHNEYARACNEQDARRRTLERDAVREKFEALICEIGAKDCEDTEPDRTVTCSECGAVRQAAHAPGCSKENKE